MINAISTEPNGHLVIINKLNSFVIVVVTAVRDGSYILSRISGFIYCMYLQRCAQVRHCRTSFCTVYTAG